MFDFDTFDTLGDDLAELRHFDAAPELTDESKGTAYVTIDGRAAWELRLPWRWLLMPLNFTNATYAPLRAALHEHLSSLGLNANNVEIFYRDEQGRIQIADIDFARRVHVGPNVSGFTQMPWNM